MRRADRLFHIVQILRRGKVVTAAHIADLNNAAAAMTIPKPVGPRDPAPVK